MRSRPATSRSMSGPPKRKCQSSGFLRISSHGPTPGTGASISTKRVTRSGYCAAKAKPTMLPMSCVTRSARSIFERVEHAGDVAGLRLLVEAAGGLGRQTQAAQVRHDHGVVAREIDGHRRPHVAGLAVAVQQHDRRSASAERTWIVVPLVLISLVRKSDGNLTLCMGELHITRHHRPTV